MIPTRDRCSLPRYWARNHHALKTPTCPLIRSLHPDGRGGDLSLGRVTGIPGPGPAHGHQRPHLHVLLAVDLAREARHSQEVAHPEEHHFSPGHVFGLALEELQPAGGASRVAAAGVHDIYACVLLDGQDQPLALLDVEGPRALYFQPGHARSLSEWHRNFQHVTPAGLSQACLPEMDYPRDRFKWKDSKGFWHNGRRHSERRGVPP